MRWPRTKCDAIALQKLTYVVCALLLPGHVGLGWKLIQKNALLEVRV
jgi:hypothetical protein